MANSENESHKPEDDDWSLGPVPSMPDSQAPTNLPEDDLQNLQPGTVLDDYQIQRVLGQGAFATVYLALQLSLNRLVALKVTGDLGYEGRRMARLEHENIVQVYAEHISRERRIRLLTMQFVPGPTLQTALSALASAGLQANWSGSALLKQIDEHSGSVIQIQPADYAIRERLQQMDHQQAVCFLTAELASGLHYAHSNGVVHRDIKPANILLNAAGRPLLVDFNLAEESTGGKDQGMVGGTLAYMSPEHLKAFESAKDAVIPVGPPADLYGLTLVFIQMLNGEVPLPTTESGRPISGSQDLSVKRLREVRAEPAKLVFEHASASQSSLQAVVQRATHPDPDQRTASAEILGQELHGCRAMRRIEIDEVMQHPLLEFATQRPVQVFAFMGFAPQIVASFVNILYNSLRVGDLPLQPNVVPQYDLMDAFTRVTIGYNVFVWPVAVILVARLLRRSVDAIRMVPCESAEEEAVQRSVVVGVPYYMLLIAACGWVPGIVVFPLALWWLAGVELFPAAVHFVLNFATCALLAITYSFLGLAWYSVSVCWRWHWRFPRRMASIQIDDEFRGYRRDLRRARIAAAVVPLVSCMLLVWTTHHAEASVEKHFELLKALVLLLTALGLLGPLLANRIATRVSDRLKTYAGRE